MPEGQPLLDHCPETLPRAAYLDADWFEREMATVFRRQWTCVGRLADLPRGRMRRVRLGTAEVVLCHGADGHLSAFHNTCRHRGSELCRGEEQPLGKLISCPYHAWSYDARDGRLISTAFGHPTPDFDRADNGLYPVTVQVWAGFVFLSAAKAPPPLRGDVPLSTLANWPMEDLVTGHRHQMDLACNWKVFWENYSECLHCPGIHPELCDMVPVYAEGVMAENERQGWTPAAPVPASNLKPGAESWTLDGALCGPPFPGLTEAERRRGYTFLTIWPTLYVVAHADYVRSVRLEPLGPTRTRLTAEWHFPAETLARPGFDAAQVAAFARIVLDQDAAAAEMNQRGIASPAFTRGRLMPEEYELHRFHTWLSAEMEMPHD